MAKAQKPLDPTGTYIQPESTGASAFQAGEQELGVKPTGWGKFIEAVKLGSLDSPLGIPLSGYEGAGVRALVQREIEKNATSKLSPEEANKRYPGLDKPFSEPVSPAVADLIASDVRRKQEMRAWIDRGGGLSGAAGLAASGLAEGLDPFNLAAGLVTGGAASALRIGGRGAAAFARVYGENVVGNLAGSAITYGQRKREGEDLTVGGELGSAALGAAVGTGLHYGVQGLIRGAGAVLGQAEGVASRMSPGAQERNLRAAIAQHEQGARIDMTPAVREAELRMSGAVQPGADPLPYRFDPEAAPGGRTFYMASGAEDGAPVPFGDFGQVGLYAVDHAQVANNLAAAPDSPFSGRLREVQVPDDAKLLSLEAKVTEGPAKAFMDALEARMGVKLDLPEGATLKDALAEIRTGFVDGPDGRRPAIREAAEIAKAQGFEGYQYVDNATSQSHHGVVLFDEARAIPGQEWTANNDITPRMTREEETAQAEVGLSPERSRSYEPDLDGRLESLKAAEPAGLKDDYMDEVVLEQETAARAFLKQVAAEDPKLETEIQALNREKARHQQETQAMKDYALCLAEGMV